MSKAMHVESKSYYDWNQQFISSSPQKVSEEAIKYEPKKLNTLGISDENFTDFLKEWRKKNL